MLSLIIRGIVLTVNTLGTIDLIKDVKDWINKKDDKDKLPAALAAESELPQEDIEQAQAAILYERIEESGKSPDDFWAGLSKEEQDKIKWSPDSVRRSMERTSFLGIANAVLWIGAAAAGGVAVVRGVAVAVKYLKLVSEALKAGQSAQKVANILATARMAALPKVGIPGFIAGILGGGGWMTGTWANNLNDVDFWGREQLRQAEEAYNKARVKLEEDYKKQQFPQPETPTVTLTKSKQAKPKVYIGTLLAGRVQNIKEMVRKVDDLITDEDDLINDVQINLTNWIATLGGKLSYEVQIKYNPFDENNVRKMGYWGTLAIYVTNNQFKRLFVDEILLGPIDPVRYWPETTMTETVSRKIAESLAPVDIQPSVSMEGKLRTVDETGAVVSVFPNSAGATQPAGQQKEQGTYAPGLTRNQLIDIAQREKTQFVYVMPNGDIIPAGINPEQAATIMMTGVVEGTTAAPVPGEILAEARKQMNRQREGFPKTIRVKVSTLYVRAYPDPTAPLAGSERLSLGDTFTAVDEVEGKNVEGENRWYLSSRGNYVWKGGTEA